VQKIFDVPAARYTVPSRNMPDGSVEIMVQPVTTLDNQELILVRSGVISAAGATTLWTPKTNKSVRVKGFSVIVDPVTTTAAGSLVTLTDGGNSVDNFLFVGATVGTGPHRFPCPLPGEGLLSAAPNNIIGVNLSAALTAGGIYVNIWGVEE